jgi:AcrR family transcriptional regulator
MGVGMDRERPSLGEETGGKGEQTRRHLIDAALSLFGEHGFRATSVRDIAAAAGANVAAVNYHFGSKENLYLAVFRELAVRLDRAELQAVRDAVASSGGRPSVEDVLGAFALEWGRPFEHPEARCAEMLVAHELAGPVMGAEFLLEELLEPVERELGEALKAACPTAGARTIQLCVHSFLAQLTHMNRVRLHLAEQDMHRVPLLDSAQAIDHIVRFTSAGLRALAESDTRSAPDSGGGS